MLKIIYDKDRIYNRTSEILEKSINNIILKKNRVVLGVPGGRSISKILEILKMQALDWEKIHIFLVDERVVPIEDPDSNFYLIKKSLTGTISERNLHPFYHQREDVERSLKDYKKEIEKFGGSYDIVLLSSGEDGHIGSLFPDHPSIYDDSDFYISVEDSPKPPSHRMSISKKFLARSEIGIMLFIGNSKRKAYINFLDNNIDYESCPAKLVKNLDDSYILTDIDL